jgi:hypothetical protein
LHLKDIAITLINTGIKTIEGSFLA